MYTVQYKAVLGTGCILGSWYSTSTTYYIYTISVQCTQYSTRLFWVRVVYWEAGIVPVQHIIQGVPYHIRPRTGLYYDFRD